MPGDVIRLRLGDIVPADARLLEGDPVEVDQSALTGESLPVARKTGEAVYSGSIIRQGEIDALVYATGAEHLLRQDRPAGAGGAHRQPLPARRAEDRRLPDHARAWRWSCVIIAVALFRGDPILDARCSSPWC